MPTLSKRSENLRTKAYQHIRTKILSGQFSAGDPLSEENLSAEIGISRTPVREALNQLITEGFLDRSGRGTSVTRPNRADVVELFELREALEAYAAGKVAKHGLPAEESARLDQICARIRGVAEELERSGEARLAVSQMDHFLSLDLQFHSWLLRAAGNWRILKVVHDARLLLRIFTMPHAGHTLDDVRRICDTHDAILDAVRRGDSVRAVQLCEAHIQRSQQERLEKYDRWERISQIRLEDGMLAGLGPAGDPDEEAAL